MRAAFMRKDLHDGAQVSDQGLVTAVEFPHFSAIFHPSTHYEWGRRFRLPTRYVLPQKASPLASRHNRGNLPVCHLALGRFHPEDATFAAAHWRASIRRPGLSSGPVD